MARTVRDAAVLLTVLGTRGTDYSKDLDERGLKGARLGIARKFFGRLPAQDKIMEDCIAEMKSRGAVIIDPVDLASNQPGESELEVLLYEFKTDLSAYLDSRGGPMRSLSELIAFNEKHARDEMRWFGQELFELAEKKGALTENAYIEALAHCRRTTREEGIDAIIQKDKLDAIVAPTGGPACLIDFVGGDYEMGSGCSTPAAVAGYPHVTVPAGFIHGLPVGISFFGTAWTESKLIRMAYAFEQTTKARMAPQFLPTVSFEA